MPLLKLSLILAIASIIVLSGVFLLWPKQNTPEDPGTIVDVPSTPQPYKTQSIFLSSSPLLSSPYSSPTPLLLTTSPLTLVEPVPDFIQRVTKKPFGLYVEPDNSPVQPERFTGYHTGADAEYADLDADVAVKSILAGTVRSARRSNGYGGIVVIEHAIDNKPHLAIYGHLDPARLIAANSVVSAGQAIGYLGQDKSDETDGERKHLHLAILPGTKLDLRGYVSNPDELANWLNPLSLFSSSPSNP